MVKYFYECFTNDFKARGLNYSLIQIIKRMVFNIGDRVVIYYRISRYLQNNVKLPVIKIICKIIGKLILVRLERTPGIYFRNIKDIGTGLMLAHPTAVGFGAGCKVGNNVTIYHEVNIGAKIIKELDTNKVIDERYPTIDDGVVIFPGAKIFGPISIGRNCIIGANSVVSESFPENCIIAGVPAKIVGRRDK